MTLVRASHQFAVGVNFAQWKSLSLANVRSPGQLSVDGTPGLDTRAVTTTVEMREGQTLAIAGLLDDAMASDRAGDLPFFYHLFGRRTVTLARRLCV